MVIVGIYGLPGTGKSTLLRELQNELDDGFMCVDGSDVIDELVDGGLDAFKKMKPEDKKRYREVAIQKIRETSNNEGKTALVAGHYMFWSKATGRYETAFTDADGEAYTHILYLQTDPSTLLVRRQDDMHRLREEVSESQLEEWRNKELTLLYETCRQHNIVCTTIPKTSDHAQWVRDTVCEFRQQSEENNAARVECIIDGMFLDDKAQCVSVTLVMDGDRTLSAQDASAGIWNLTQAPLFFGKHDGNPLDLIFRSKMHYSYAAFRQVSLLYEQVAPNEEHFTQLCSQAAGECSMHEDFNRLIQKAGTLPYVRVIVLTSGLREVWERLLNRNRLLKNVTIVGGGRGASSLVVNDEIKGAVVTRLRGVHNQYVWAFGDSSIDLQMLQKANKALIIVGPSRTRSKTFVRKLKEDIEAGTLKARQVLLPAGEQPIPVEGLDVCDLNRDDYMDRNVLINRAWASGDLQITLAGETNSSKVLMTPMRDAACRGPQLREAHRRVGHYLASEFITGIVGFEKYPMKHVQGQIIAGYRLLYEQKTTIVALMRGGEPMAFGVNDAFPQAMFVHAKKPEELKPEHLSGQRNIILVDSVINTGASIIEFIQHVQDVQENACIIVIAGVIQAEAAEPMYGPIARAVNDKKRLYIIALRKSETKYKGMKGNDTGHRLFNTTHMK